MKTVERIDYIDKKLATIPSVIIISLILANTTITKASDFEKMNFNTDINSLISKKTEMEKNNIKII